MPKCRKCQKKFEVKYFNQKYCMEKDACIAAFLKSVAEAKKQALRDNVEDYSKKLQTKINHIARLVDYGLPCLAKDYFPGQMHAGHVFSRGAEKSMRYNLHNIHRQSAQSNWKQNEDGLLREKLRQEYGDLYFEFLSDLRRMPPLKYSNLEYKEFYEKASEIVNLMKKRPILIADPNDRAIVRNEINIEMSIYDLEYCIYEP